MWYSYLYMSLMLSFIIVCICPAFVSGLTFTVVTPVVTATTGETARLVWTYTVGNRNTEFGNKSPIWYKLNGTEKTYKLMYDNVLASWALTIAPECPDEYKTRIGREGVATMFIRNVVKGDTGNYSCVLRNPGGGSLGDKSIELIVSDPTPTPTSSTPLATTNSTGSTNATTTAPPGRNTGAIVGGVIGKMVVLGLAAFGIWYQLL